MNISVLTLVKNRAEHLAQSIEGLRRSEVAPMELIIVDMASEPPIPPMNTPFPTRIVRLETSGLPLAAARNAAAKAAQGDILLFLDVDCIPMRGLIDAVGKACDGRDALICAPARYLGPDDARGYWTEADLLSRSVSHPARDFPAKGLRVENDPGLFWSLAFAIRRGTFLELGGFDEAFTGYGGEDTDFGFRARKAQVPLLFMGGAGVFHQFHDTFDPPFQHFRDILRNAGVFRDKWGQWPMPGWLAAFEQAGLIATSENRITVLSEPSAAQLAGARVSHVPYAAPAEPDRRSVPLSSSGDDQTAR
jgi:GT2 family glycosyltransferase